MNIPYPDPVPRKSVERMVTEMAERMGWDAKRTELEIGRAQRRIRMRKWLNDMGVGASREARRAYVERKRDAWHARIREEREGKDEE